MPRFDGSGPNGAGPMSGRGMGGCCRRFGGRGLRNFGFRRGSMFGCRFMNFQGHMDSEMGVKDLAEYKKELEREIELVEKEIKEFKK